MLVSNEEIENLKKIFIKLDTSNDGFLSTEEIKNGLDLALGSFKLS
jgi:Ca2+-binding EF-hand superfamily protein